MKTLRFCAALSIVLHVLGLFAALFWIKPGMLGVDNEAAMNYVATSTGFRLGWGVWMLAAMSFVAFMAALEHHSGVQGTLARLALMVGVGAATTDGVCDMIHIAVSPELASQGPDAHLIFYAFERFASSIGIVWANGLYAISVVLMTEALREKISSRIRALGWVVLVTGLALSATDFFGSPLWPQVFTGPAIGSYMLWVFAVTWSLSRR